MLKKLLDISGSMSSVLSVAFGMSEQHRQVLSNGWKCPRCNDRLMSTVGGVTANFYAADGSRMSKWTGGGLRAETVECPKCSYRWKMYGDAPAVQPFETQIVDIIETERSEEFLGEDRRVIDNTKNSGSPSRSFSFTKEWSKTFHVEVERAHSGGAEITLGSKDAGALRLSSEDKLRRTYSVSAETKETTTEDVSCVAPAFRKLTIIVRWKRIWQHGVVVALRDGGTLHIPFRVAVAATFDQQQIEEDGSATDASAAV